MQDKGQHFFCIFYDLTGYEALNFGAMLVPLEFNRTNKVLGVIWIYAL